MTVYNTIRPTTHTVGHMEMVLSRTIPATSVYVLRTVVSDSMLSDDAASC